MLIYPEYPSQMEEKKIEKIAVKLFNADSEGQATGKLILKMTHSDAQFGNSSLEVEINYSYSYVETYLDKEVITKKYLRQNTKNI